MAVLYFKVQSDWENVVKLRDEISKLENQLKSFGRNTPEHEIKVVETQLAAARQEFVNITTEAAKAGASIENDFKRKIYDASQSVNDFTEKIISQKSIVKDVEYDVKRLGEAYRTALKNNSPTASSKLDEYRAAKKTLDEEKAALFALTQEQANARLSVKKLRDEYALFKEESEDSKENIRDVAAEMKDWIAGIAGGIGIKNFISQMIKVRSEFQAADTAIQTLLGSKEKADALMSQVREYAKISPLEFSDVTQATQMMLGFNIEAEKVPRFLQAIGDVSMGESGKFNSLTLAFSQMSAAGKLMGQDLNQMINAGFNPLQIIAEKTDKSIAQLQDEMSKGAITAEMVQQAFIDATSEGGKFYQMSENASKTIQGQLSTMQDAMDAAFNEMGQASEGVIMKGIQLTTSLIKNYETIGKVLVGLIATYGTYRAGILSVSVIEQARNKTLLSNIKATQLATIVQRAYNAVLNANPFVLLATAVVGLTTAVWSLCDSTSAAEKEAERLQRRTEEQKKSTDNYKNAIDELVSKVKDEKIADDERQEALNRLKEMMPDVFGKYETFIELVKNSAAALKEEADAIRKRDKSLIKQNYLSDKRNLKAIERFFQYEEMLKKGSISKEEYMRENPYGGLVLAFREITGSQNNVYSTIVDWAKKYLPELRKTVESEASAIRDTMNAEFDTGIGTKKRNDLLREIEDYQKKIKTAKEEGKSSIDVDDVAVPIEEFERRLNAARERLEKLESEASVDFIERARKNYEEASERVREIIRNRNDRSIYEDEASYLSALNEAREKEKEAEKAYKAVGGESKKARSEESDNAKKQQAIADQHLSLRRQNLQNEINLMEEGTEKRLAQIDFDYDRQIAEIRKKEQEWSEAQGGKLTEEQAIQISLAYTQADEKKNKAIKDAKKNIEDAKKAQLEADRQAMNEYLKEYGDYMEKRQAIADLYNDEMTKAATEGERLTLQRQMEEALQNIDISNLKDSIDWEQVFGNLDKVSTDALVSLKKKLRDFVATQKDLSPENMKELVEAIEKIDEKISERNPFATMKESFAELKLATDALREAQEAYNEALENGTDEEKKNAKATLESAKSAKQKALSEATVSLHNGVDEVRQYVDAGNEIMGIMETVGVKIPDSLKGFTEGLGGVLDGLSSIDLTKPMSIVTGSLQSIKGALTAVVSLGGLIPGFGGADYSQYNKMKEEYDTLLNIWDELISKKQEYISIDYGIEAKKAAEEATRLVKTNIARVKQLADQLAGSGASIGSHSLGYRVNDRMDRSAWREVSELVGENVSSLSDLFNVDPSKIGNALQSERLVSVLTAVNSDFITYIKDMEKYAEQLEQIAQAEKEAFTGVSFESFRDSFIDTLADLDSRNQDFAENFEKYLQNAVFSSLVANQYKDRIQALYDKWAAYAESDNKLSKEEAEALREEQERITEDMLKEREEFMKAFGWTSSGSYSQEASGKGFASMSQDTGEELNGRFTAIQISNEEIKNLTQITNDWLARIYAQLNGSNLPNVASENKNIMAGSYSPVVSVAFQDGKLEALTAEVSTLRGIVDEMRTLQVNSALDSQTISENTSVLARNSPKITSGVEEMNTNIKNRL